MTHPRIDWTKGTSVTQSRWKLWNQESIDSSMLWVNITQISYFYANIYILYITITMKIRTVYMNIHSPRSGHLLDSVHVCSIMLTTICRMPIPVEANMSWLMPREKVVTFQFTIAPSLISTFCWSRQLLLLNLYCLNQHSPSEHQFRIDSSKQKGKGVFAIEVN